MQRPRGYNKGGIFAEKSPTLSANSWQQNNLLVSRPKDGIRQLNPSRESGGTQPYQQNRVYAADGKSPALMNGHGGQTINALVGGASSQTANADGVRPTANYTKVVQMGSIGNTAIPYVGQWLDGRGDKAHTFVFTRTS